MVKFYITLVFKKVFPRLYTQKAERPNAFRPVRYTSSQKTSVPSLAITSEQLLHDIIFRDSDPLLSLPCRLPCYFLVHL